MKLAQPASLVKAENAMLFILVVCFYFFYFHFSFIWFIALLLAPDISAVGFLILPKFGISCYNVFHILFIPVLLVFIGLGRAGDIWTSCGLIWLCHIYIDRALGFTLRSADDSIQFGLKNSGDERIERNQDGDKN